MAQTGHGFPLAHRTCRSALMEDPTDVLSPQPPGPVNAPDLPADRPCIAVLPFANIGGEPDDRHLCDGVTQDIITELSRFRDIMVIARGSMFTIPSHSADTVQFA